MVKITAKSILDFFRLIRWGNLTLIAGLMYALRYLLLRPTVLLQEQDLVLTHFQFFLVVASTLVIAAAGYIINDYFDLKIDAINKPERLIVGRTIKRRVAMGAHAVLSILGVLMGGFVAYSIGLWQLVFIPIFWVFALWFYSTTFKKQLLVGNLMVAIMLALVPLTVGLFEIPLLNIALKKIKDIDPNYNYNFLAYWILAYAFFAFMLTLAREITKDAQDQSGDAAYQAETVPIVWGPAVTKTIIIALYGITIGVLVYLQQKFLNQPVIDPYSPYYINGLLVGTLVLAAITTARAKQPQDFKIPSFLNKIAVLEGIVYLFLVNYLITA